MSCWCVVALSALGAAAVVGAAALIVRYLDGDK